LAWSIARCTSIGLLEDDMSDSIVAWGHVSAVSV